MIDKKHFRFYSNIETTYGNITSISYEDAILKAKDQETYLNLVKEENILINIFNEDIKTKPYFDINKTTKNNQNITLLFEHPISKDTLQKAIASYPKPKHIQVKPKFNIEQTNTIESFEAHDFVKNTVPIIMELLDENTNTDRIYALIRNMPNLEEDILKLANNAYSNKGIEINDIKSAIIRLGLLRIRKLTIEAISRESVLYYKDELKDLSELETALILQTAIFDKVCQMISVSTNRIYDLLILSMIDGLLIIIDFLNKNNDTQTNTTHTIKSQILNMSKSPSKLYSYVSRIFEKDTFGKDVIRLNKEYFDRVFYGFEDFIKAIIIGYNSYTPIYRYNSLEKLNVNDNTFKIAFPIYISILGTKFVLQNDQRSALIMANRLSRFGIDKLKLSSFLKTCINEANLTLKDLGIQKEISTYLKNIDYKASIDDKKTDKAQDNTIAILQEFYTSFINIITTQKRVCVRYEDKAYTMDKIERLINYISQTQEGVLGIIDLKTFEMPPYEDLSFFDVLILKDIDQIKDVGKLKALLKQFEGYIVLSLRNDIDLESTNRELFNEIFDFSIDFPSYMNDDELYQDTIKSAKTLIKNDFGIDVDMTHNDKLDFKSIIRQIIKDIK